MLKNFSNSPLGAAGRVAFVLVGLLMLAVFHFAFAIRAYL